MNNSVIKHQTADVQSSTIGEGTRIWQFVIILPQAKIGEKVNICSHCFVENDVVIGDRVTVKSGVQLWDGIRIEDDVFIGPNVTFSNDKFPRSKQYPEKFLETRIEKGASIGAGAVILPGITIGKGAMIGAGAIVTKSVPPYAIVTSSASKIVGYVKADITPSLNQPSAQVAEPIEMGVGKVSLYQFKLIQDPRGDLSVGEFMREIPFFPKRYFLVLNVPTEKVRGEHAHHECHQFLVCVKGYCSVRVDDGKNRKETQLDAPNKGLYLPPMIWGVQYKFSQDAVLLVFTSDYYQAEDYIHDYTAFCALVSQRRAIKEKHANHKTG